MLVMLRIETDGAAFEDWQFAGEIARILSEVAGRIGGMTLLTGEDQRKYLEFYLTDANGNRVGYIRSEEE